MLKHEPVLPPEFIYPIDDWRVVESRLNLRALAATETIFSTANGYLGMRGAFEEGAPAIQHGTFVNGFYESWPIPYGEKAFGFATTGQTIVNVPDAKIVRLYVDDEPFDLESAHVLRFERTLDLRSGTLDREVLWETPAGRQILVHSRRLVSFHEKHVAALCYRVTVVNAKASLVLSSEIVQHVAASRSDDDPRLASAAATALLPKVSEATSLRIVLGWVTRSSGMALGLGIDHRLETACGNTSTCIAAEGSGQVVFHVDAEPGTPVTLTKYLTYHTSRSDKAEELCARAHRTLDRVVAHGFGRLARDQRAYLDEFWERTDVEVSAGHPRAQQCVRWNLFQLVQAAARADSTGIPARGLTAQTYDGHYFWDMEMYLVPFLTYTSPSLARNVLRYRHGILDKARARAREVSQKGALFPWRTINGDEASAYYAAGTAQYHINAAVAHAVMRYVDVTGDEQFMRECGAEILVETARLWADLGFFSDRQDGRFCIHGVTGPDEYTTVVNNNTYTNLMARENLRDAAMVVERLRIEHADDFQALVRRTGLDLAEVQDWRHAADRMYVPFDRRLRIHPQDDAFLDREVWDFEDTPSDRYPLLLYYHPLVIYRHQVIKQADVVLAMFLLGHEFTLEQKKRNFDYYDPLTTGDSSLSVCIQSIVAAEIGYHDVALRYLRYALLMDLADVGGNVRDGCHVASMGGTWMAMVYGLAGLRDHRGRISFDPKPIAGTLRFPLAVWGQQLRVAIEGGAVTYLLTRGTGLTIRHRDEEIVLREGEPVRRELSEVASPQAHNA